MRRRGGRGYDKEVDLKSEIERRSDLTLGLLEIFGRSGKGKLVRALLSAEEGGIEYQNTEKGEHSSGGSTRILGSHVTCNRESRIRAPRLPSAQSNSILHPGQRKVILL